MNKNKIIGELVILMMAGISTEVLRDRVASGVGKI